MLSERAIFSEIRANDQAYRFVLSVAAKGETQGGWENERIAELTADRDFARRIRRHGEDESKHGRLFRALLRKRGLEPVAVPADADYCMLLERRGIGLAHARLRRDEPLSDEEILRYLVHSRVTEQRSSEEIARQLVLFGDDPELKRALAMIADDEVNHLCYCHEELLRFTALGHGETIGRMLRDYAQAEIAVYRQVSLRFIDEMAAILGWSGAKQGLLQAGVQVVNACERMWGWRRMVRLAPPERPNALGGVAPAEAAAFS